MQMRSSETCTTNKTHSQSRPWWWCGGGHGAAASADVSKEKKTNWASPKRLEICTGTPRPKTSICQRKIQLEETISESTIEEIQMTLSPHSGGKSATTTHKSNTAAGSSIMLPIVNNEFLASSSHSQLLSHSMACTSYSYHDACYAGVMPPFGVQTLVQSQYGSSEMLHAGRLALPLQVAEEPVYVNAKQYHGILRRRQSRAKAEVEKRIIRTRKPYLHESRHLHAMRRERGCGGRFLSKKVKTAASDDSPTPHEKASNVPSVALSSDSVSSELCFININAADSYQTNHHRRQLTAEPSNADAPNCYQTHQGSVLHLSAYI